MIDYTPPSEAQSDLDNLADFVNARIVNKSDPWVACFEDGGYGLSPDSEHRRGGVHMGPHILLNEHDTLGQQVHIDGVGHPGEEIPEDLLEDFQGPLSGVYYYTSHPGTQFGEAFPLADMYYDMWRGRTSPDDLCDTVTEALQRNERMFDEELASCKGKLPIVPAGTLYLFVKNQKMHRGVARGPAKFEGDMRAVLYVVFMRKSKLAKYLQDKMETAELAIGFTNGVCDRYSVVMWTQQLILGLQRAYLLRNLVGSFIFCLYF
jgi:hypothetical protein